MSLAITAVGRASFVDDCAALRAAAIIGSIITAAQAPIIEGQWMYFCLLSQTRESIG